MTKLTDKSKEGKHDNPNIDVREHTRMAFPYLLQLFHAGLEKRHGVRLSIQCSDSGTFRGALTAITELGTPAESGIVTFSNGESLDGILAYFEDGLTYGDLTWRVDKFWSNSKDEVANTPSKRTKVPLHL